MKIAQSHVSDTIKAGSPARAKPFVPADTPREVLPAFPGPTIRGIDFVGLYLGPAGTGHRSTTK